MPTPSAGLPRHPWRDAGGDPLSLAIARSRWKGEPMTTPQGGPTGQRALEVWRDEFRRYSQGAAPATGSMSHSSATTQDVADALLHAALAFDAVITQGAIPPGQAEQSMLLLLLVRDHLMPLQDSEGALLNPVFGMTLEAIRRDDRPRPTASE